MSDGLILDEHRPAADGTRPLQVGQRLRQLSPQLLEGEASRVCWSTRWASWFEVDAPAHCRGQIVPGEHFLLWTEHDINGRPTGRSEAYCAPCAIAEWREYQVCEATG